MGNREIKFRAWAIKEKMLMHDIGIFPMGNKLAWAGNPKKPNTSEPLINPKSDDFVIMQYTGLTDRHGKEIYEGDILRGYFKTDDVEDWLWLTLTDDEKETGSRIFPPVTIPDFYQNPLPEQLEVLGNIYENPELLKKDKG